MRALAEVGIAVPGDMSIASIDDFPWASAFLPALTVVRQPIQAMAGEAFAMLMQRIAGDDSEPRHAVFEPELVVRSSCAPVNNTGRTLGRMMLSGSGGHPATPSTSFSSTSASST
jgi:LacI family transcriptional regulator